MNFFLTLMTLSLSSLVANGKTFSVIDSPILLNLPDDFNVDSKNPALFVDKKGDRTILAMMPRYVNSEDEAKGKLSQVNTSEFKIGNAPAFLTPIQKHEKKDGTVVQARALAVIYQKAVWTIFMEMPKVLTREMESESETILRKTSIAELPKISPAAVQQFSLDTSNSQIKFYEMRSSSGMRQFHYTLAGEPTHRKDAPMLMVLQTAEPSQKKKLTDIEDNIRTGSDSPKTAKVKCENTKLNDLAAIRCVGNGDFVGTTNAEYLVYVTGNDQISFFISGSAPKESKMTDEFERLLKTFSIKQFVPNEKSALGPECEKGNPLACTNLGVLYANEGALDKAIELSLRACDMGDALGCYNVACHFCRKKNPKNAIRYFKISIEKGFSTFLKQHPKFVIDQDPDMSCIKNDAEFKKLLERTKR